MDRCQIIEGTLEEAIAEAARAKVDFTESDIEARARRTLAKWIIAVTQFMRTHVEVDPRVGLKSFHALKRLKQIYQWAIDLQICVFPQEGLTNDAGTEDLLVAACREGADLIGGYPYIRDRRGEILFIYARQTGFMIDRVRRESSQPTTLQGSLETRELELTAESQHLK